MNNGDKIKELQTNIEISTLMHLCFQIFGCDKDRIRNWLDKEYNPVDFIWSAFVVELAND